MNDFIVALIAQAAVIESDRIEAYNELNDIEAYNNIESLADLFWFQALMTNPYMRAS
jgi:hypothetical protein